MLDKGKVTLTMCVGALIVFVIGALLWHGHYRMSGLFVGFAVGIGCSVVAYNLIAKRKDAKTPEVPSPKQ